MLSTSSDDKAEAVKKLVGLDDSVPQDIARRLEMLALGSVDPEADLELAVKLCTHFPIEFFSLTNAITKLTGQGAEIKKKRNSSGATPT